MKPIPNEEGAERIDLNSLTNHLCDVHEFVLDLDKQECQCEKCSLGFKWSPSTLDINQYNFTLNKWGKTHKITFILKNGKRRPRPTP